MLGTRQPFQFQMGGNQPNSNAPPANTFMFSGGKQNQSLPAAAPAQQLQPVQPTFNFGSQQASGTVASSGNANQGYKFSLGAGPNLNFGSQTTFSATNDNTASATELSKRVIKKATRRKK